MNVPPTSSQLERVEELTGILRKMFDAAPIPFQYEENTDAEYPLHMWGSVHHTIPARMLAVQFGLPEHEPDCECVEPPPIMLRMTVRDLDTEERVPDSGLIEVLDPQGQEFIAGVCVMAVTCFNITGTL